jgi:hypothetical protein
MGPPPQLFPKGLEGWGGSKGGGKEYCPPTKWAGRRRHLYRIHLAELKRTLGEGNTPPFFFFLSKMSWSPGLNELAELSPCTPLLWGRGQV